ncbi:MAG: hypothetical protein JWL80_304 [Parcubacteria group bacterium]|nr:hypothetical protein [Parcubacteria group bacterium]
MPGRGLEPPPLAGPVPKTGVSTISPPRHEMHTNTRNNICAPGRNRTYDHLLKRELLYQLSYGRVTKTIAKKTSLFNVPGVGLEPTRSCDQRILSPPCIPFHHPGMESLSTSWRPRAESNRRWSFCRAMPYHLATRSMF